MPTPKFPFCYAIKNGDEIALYVLVYVPSGQSVSFGAGRARGQTMLFDLAIIGTPDNNNSIFKEAHIYPDFSVTNPVIDTIEVKTLENGNAIKTTRLIVADLDVVTSRLGLPAKDNANIALDTPYVCTQKIDKDSLQAEVVVITDSPVSYTKAYNGPTISSKNTESKIEIGGTNATTTEIITDHIFTVTDFGTLLDDDGHLALFNPNAGVPPKIRQNKTKNKNHTPTPFPKPRPKKK